MNMTEREKIFYQNLNILFGYNAWSTPVWETLEMIEELKSIGFYDQFEIVHLEKVQDEESQKKVQAILEKYKCKNLKN